jgi:hypothetical protein
VVNLERVRRSGGSGSGNLITIEKMPFEVNKNPDRQALNMLVMMMRL